MNKAIESIFNKTLEQQRAELDICSKLLKQVDEISKSKEIITDIDKINRNIQLRELIKRLNYHRGKADMATKVLMYIDESERC